MSKPHLIRNKKGQVVVEYLLIMALVVAIAATLTKKLVGRSDSDPGMIVESWARMIKVIGNDLPDCSKQTNFANPNCPD